MGHRWPSIGLKKGLSLENSGKNLTWHSQPLGRQTCDSQFFSAPKRDLQKTTGSIRMIRVHRLIRTNLRMDSHESGHLSSMTPKPPKNVRLCCVADGALGQCCRGAFFGELVDPVVADPIAQDSDKRIYIYIHTQIPFFKYTEGGDKTSQYVYLVVILPLAELGPREFGLPIAEFFVRPASEKRSASQADFQNFGRISSTLCILQ